MKKIVIADHHPVTRKGITCMLKKDENFQIVGKANNGTELYKTLEEVEPDILIMEIDMPQINGINALRSIKQKFPELRVLIFSTHPEEIYALRAIKSGAAGYVPKSASSKILLKALDVDFDVLQESYLNDLSYWEKKKDEYQFPLSKLLFIGKESCLLFNDKVKVSLAAPG